MSNANKSLGVKKLFFYDFPALKLDHSYIAEIADVINQKIIDYKPHKIFIPNGNDIHTDHVIIHEACLVACRPIEKFKIKEVLSYETLSETEWGKVQFHPNKFEILNKNNLQNKIKAFRKYKSQIKKIFTQDLLMELKT